MMTEPVRMEGKGIKTQPNTAQSHYREAIHATLLGLGVNFALGIIKLVGGIAGQSIALISDAVNSLGDSIASILTFFALRFAQLPADDEHPYGHSRAEAIAGLCISALILASAGYIGWEAFSHLMLKHPIPPWWTLAIAAGNVVVKEALYWYTRIVGIRTGSTAIVANAWDHRSDALCSLAVLVGLGVIILGGERYIWADEVAALIVAAAILWSGSRLLLRSISELLDPQAEPTFVAEIRQAASEIEHVLAVEKLRVRKTGIEYLVDIHVQVDGDMSVTQGHRVGHHVRDKIIAQFSNVRDVLVHLEPYRE